jgi:hypothetical protein
MTKRFVVALFLIGCSNAAAADSAASPFAGRWYGEMAKCGSFALEVAYVRPDGAIDGQVGCPKLGIVRSIGGQAINGKQLHGWIDGVSLHLQGDHAMAHVTLEAGKLVGIVKVPLSQKEPVVLIRR